MTQLSFTEILLSNQQYLSIILIQDPVQCLFGYLRLNLLEKILLIIHTGILAWTELPNEIKCLTSKFLFFLFDHLNDQEAGSYILFLTWSYIFSSYIWIYIYIYIYIYVSLFLTSIYLIITGIYSFKFCLVHHLPYTIYICAIFLLGSTMEISVFTFLCYPGTFMYLCVLVLLYVFTY